MAKLLFGSLAWFSFPSFADNKPLNSPVDYLSVLLSLVVVIALVFMLGYIMRRFNVTQQGGGQMKVVGSMALGTRERILVIQVGEEQHMLGVTAQNINHLAKLDSPLEVAQPSGDNFKDKLTQLMQGQKGKTHD
ncbi:flagellar biosynthetic protein FliO [Bowmanella pacifica]|uniref:Flagellar protein n=1 Tax=Bowmanella pacifica TaxID=502051 RepID=A0A918DGC4_9ALTE|nr:flagellar biosynthetic protein FliO [Bowmanella pacifica]GGO63509.1 flagellar protein [Bowmanella pacifica]